MIKIPCPYCNGDGFTSFGDRHVENRKESCQRCGGTGEIDPETGQRPETSSGGTEGLYAARFGQPASDVGGEAAFREALDYLRPIVAHNPSGKAVTWDTSKAEQAFALVEDALARQSASGQGGDLREAAQRALNQIESDENEIDHTLKCGDILRAALATPAAHPATGGAAGLDREAVAWSFELARWRNNDGTYGNWDKPQLSFDKPRVPEGSIRNLRPLYALDPADQPQAASEDDVLFAFHRYVKAVTPEEVSWWTRAFPRHADAIREYAVEKIDMDARAAITPDERGAGAGGSLFRTGDHVHHGPSGETWVVAYCDQANGVLAACGWPFSEARISDCTLTKSASEEDHQACVEAVLQNCGVRASRLQFLLDRSAAPAAPTAPGETR